MKIRIYYHHTDCAGTVYYANYLIFLEEARTEFLEKRGLSIKELVEQGVLFVVSRQEIDYKAPAFYGDILEIEARLINISKVRMEFAYEIKNQSGRLICSAKTVMACVDADLKPSAISEKVRQKLSS